MADLSDRPTPFLFDNSDATGAAIDLASRLGVLDSAEIVSRVTELLKKDPDPRSWAARICGSNSQPELVGILIALTQDPHPSVRATAVSWLAYAYVNGRSDPATVTALQACASDPGRQLPAALAAEPEPGGPPGRSDGWDASRVPLPIRRPWSGKLRHNRSPSSPTRRLVAVRVRCSGGPNSPVRTLDMSSRQTSS